MVKKMDCLSNKTHKEISSKLSGEWGENSNRIPRAKGKRIP